MSEASRADDRFRSDLITSPANPVVRFLRSLQRKKERQFERAFVVEGVRGILDALDAGAVPLVVAISDAQPIDPDLQHRLGTLDERVSVRFIQANVFSTVVDTVSPQPIVAAFPLPELSLPATDAPLYVIVDGLADPGNLGTLIRSAAGAGATAVMLYGHTVDPFNPKAVRAAVGAYFRIPVIEMTDECLSLVQACSVRALADAAEDHPPDAIDWRGPSCIIIGGEAHGPSDAMRSLANTVVAIPLHARVESLNAAVAGSVILFEAARQRRSSGELAG